MEDGANIKAWDPIGGENFKKVYPKKMVYCKTIEETLIDADICFIFKEWDDVINFDILKYEKLMKKPIILDGRNCYSVEAFKNIKTVYNSIGRSTMNMDN